MRKALAVLAILLGIAGIVGLKLTSKDPRAPESSVTSLQTITILVGDNSFAAEIAANAEEQQKGLSGRTSLTENAAMLFPYEEPGTHCFWMKDMNFAIDMIWLDSNKQITHIEKDVQPETYPDKSFCSDAPAQYVVEFAAGTAAKNNWQHSTQFSF